MVFNSTVIYVHLFFLKCFENTYLKEVQVFHEKAFDIFWRIFNIHCHIGDFIIKIPGFIMYR